MCVLCCVCMYVYRRVRLYTRVYYYEKCAKCALRSRSLRGILSSLLIRPPVCMCMCVSVSRSNGLISACLLAAYRGLPPTSSSYTLVDYDQTRQPGRASLYHVSGHQDGYCTSAGASTSNSRAPHASQCDTNPARDTETVGWCPRGVCFSYSTLLLSRFATHCFSRVLCGFV
jgi:hypothetical protein